MYSGRREHTFQWILLIHQGDLSDRAAQSSEESVHCCQTTWHDTPDYGNFHGSNHHENLKPFTLFIHVFHKYTHTEVIKFTIYHYTLKEYFCRPVFYYLPRRSHCDHLMHKGLPDNATVLHIDCSSYIQVLVMVTYLANHKCRKLQYLDYIPSETIYAS
jgi:hypothetical protein